MMSREEPSTCVKSPQYEFWPSRMHLDESPITVHMWQVYGNAMTETYGRIRQRRQSTGFVLGTAESGQELSLKLGIKENVSITLDCEHADAPSVGLPRFVISGPPAVLARVRDICRGSIPIGYTSPQHKVTIPLPLRVAYCVPEAAVSFAFLYPLAPLAKRWKDVFQWEGVSVDICHLLTLGGFVYFDANGALVQVNALFADADNADAQFIFHGPHASSLGATKALRSAGRLMDMHMSSSGVGTFGWVNPLENPGGCALSANAGEPCHTNGAFLYTRDTDDAVFYSLHVLNMEAATHAVELSSARLSAAASTSHRSRDSGRASTIGSPASSAVSGRQLSTPGSPSTPRPPFLHAGDIYVHESSTSPLARPDAARQPVFGARPAALSRGGARTPALSKSVTIASLGGVSSASGSSSASSKRLRQPDPRDLDQKHFDIHGKTMAHMHHMFDSMVRLTKRLDDRMAHMHQDMAHMHQDVLGHLHRIDHRIASVNSGLTTLLRGEHDCPRMLVIEPAGTAWEGPCRWVAGQRMRLHFLCEVTYAPAGEGFEFELPPDWLRALGPALAVSARVLANPFVSMLAQGALGDAIGNLSLPLGNDNLLQELWSDLADELEDGGVKDLVQYARDQLGQSASAAEAATERSLDARLPPDGSLPSSASARRVRRVKKSLQKSYEQVKRLLGKLEPNRTWEQQRDDRARCGVVKAVSMDSDVAWVDPRWMQLYEQHGARIMGLKVEQFHRTRPALHCSH